jgi:hypothetical protein
MGGAFATRVPGTMRTVIAAQATEKSMPDKQPMQAMSTSHDGAHDGVADRPDKDGGFDAGGKGESDGGAYPNPHTGKKAPGGFGKFLGHGGQTEQGYYGGGQAGADVDADNPNVNATSREP